MRDDDGVQAALVRDRRPRESELGGLGDVGAGTARGAGRAYDEHPHLGRASTCSQRLDRRRTSSTWRVPGVRPVMVTNATAIGDP